MKALEDALVWYQSSQSSGVVLSQDQVILILPVRRVDSLRIASPSSDDAVNTLGTPYKLMSRPMIMGIQKPFQGQYPTGDMELRSRTSAKCIYTIHNGYKSSFR